MKKISLIVLTAVLILIFTACQGTDVVGKVALTSFEQILNAMPDKIEFDEQYNGFALITPTEDRFFIGKDFSVEGQPDLMLDFDAKPFVNAGLDISKLPADMYQYDEMMDMIMVLAEIGDHPSEYKGEVNMLEAFRHVVKNHREVVGYHEKLDHYGVALGNGNMFEWAKNMATNDKDLVFVLNPQPFIDAGVDPTKVEGWVFAKVEIMDQNGKPIEVDKLLKPLNIK
ncbi:MAG: hypothetical protein ACOZCL_13535 [Bacillota bacterium]